MKKDPVPVKSAAKSSGSGSVFNAVKNGTKNLVVNTFNLMIGDDAKLAFGKDKSFLQRSAGSANLLLTAATFGGSAIVKSSVKGTIQLTEKVTAKFFTSAVVKDAAEIAGTKAIQKAAQQTSAAVGNQTVQEMLSNSPSGLYSKLRQQGIPTTLTNDEVKAANSVNLRMQAEGTSNAINRFDGGPVHIPMDADRFNRMKNAFEKQGGLIVKEDEALPLLNYHGVEASTLDATTIAFRPNPSTSAVFEEFIHATQYRTGRANGSNIIQMEIEAKEKLINFRKAYRIPNSETRDTIQQLREYRQMLKK